MKKLLRADGALYLVRYTLLWLPFLKIRLHHILLSDTECLHDHPWNFISVVLKGGYWEVSERTDPGYLEALAKHKILSGDLFKEMKWYPPGSFLFRKAKFKHRLELMKGKTAWTLVFMFRRKREWGFWNKDKFIPHADYVMTENCE